MNKLLLTAALLLSSACSTTAGTEYFALPDSQYQLPDGRGNETAVQVILADPLDHGDLEPGFEAARKGDPFLEQGEAAGVAADAQGDGVVGLQGAVGLRCGW